MIEGQSKITSEMYLMNKKRDERKTGEGTLGKDDFMKLLIAQLQNQDPTAPMKDNEFIAQMAQFSALEQTMNLAKSFDKFAAAQNESQMIQYNSFVGKTVKWDEVKLDEDGKPEVDEAGKPVMVQGTGVIEKLKYINGSVVFTLTDGKDLTPGNISELISSGSSSNSLVEASMLIGKTVTYKTADDEEQSGVVSSVTNKDGKVHYVLADGTKVEGNQFIAISK